MKKIAILTSGGDAPGMNAAIRAVTRVALYHNVGVYGIERGFEGLINGEFKELEVHSVSDTMQRGGTWLKTARSERFRTPEGFRRALDMLENFEVKGLVIIGGDGSFRGGLELSKGGITVMGLPGTIDNDLAYTDYSIGFDTAVNTVLSAIGNIRDTSSSHERGTVIEVMGRHSGAIALYAGLTGGAETILTPEEPIDINKVCRVLIQGKNRGKKHNIVICAEGAEITSQDLTKTIIERTGLDMRLVILGHIQRGGSPTARDRMLASRMGYKAVELLLQDGMTSKAVGIKGEQIVAYDLEEALKVERTYDESIMDLAEILS
ncbi:MAG: 6-phosphofructokinase [Eubacteriales bacterium]|nr:6-phosphofructokinase [Eubacteriales bacterium]MDD3198732.1 6-phosphofructokinase [Eubacteriales bacterium]MDD4122053.1 6-phosphofructokinase [Eubacteriales bacterium]MDD4629022.1 6-phosphofructokinase [Eubacteriales bacterium]